MIKVEVYPPDERDAVDIGLLRFSVTSDGSSEETLSTSVGWTVHRTFGILAEVISDSDAGSLGTVGPVSPGSTVIYNIRITDSSEDAGTTNWVIKNPSAVQRNIDEDPSYATWMYDITDVEGNIALVASLTGGQYVDVKLEMTVRQQVEAGLHTIYMQVAEESDGDDEPVDATDQFGVVFVHFADCCIDVIDLFVMCAYVYMLATVRDLRAQALCSAFMQFRDLAIATLAW